jgi:hypothetical protein
MVIQNNVGVLIVFKFLTLIVIAFALTGCATTKEVLVVKIKTVLISPPDELMEKCTVNAPPDIKEYVQSNWQKKEELLVTYSGQQMKNLFTCDEKLKNLREWKVKQINLYPTEAK